MFQVALGIIVEWQFPSSQLDGIFVHSDDLKYLVKDTILRSPSVVVSLFPPWSHLSPHIPWHWPI